MPYFVIGAPFGKPQNYTQHGHRMGRRSRLHQHSDDPFHTGRRIFPRKCKCSTLWRSRRKNKNSPLFGAGLVRARHQISNDNECCTRTCCTTILGGQLQSTTNCTSSSFSSFRLACSMRLLKALPYTTRILCRSKMLLRSSVSRHYRRFVLLFAFLHQASPPRNIMMTNIAWLQRRVWNA